MVSATMRSAKGTRCGCCSTTGRPALVAAVTRADLDLGMAMQQAEKLAPHVAGSSGHGNRERHCMTMS